MSVNVRAFAVLLVLPLTSCEWFTDFKRQPSIWTWEAGKDSTTPSRGNPQFSVPTTGTAVAGYQVSYGALPITIDSMAAIANPVPVTDSSLANGRMYYQINCAVCHGDRGMGDGAATRFGMAGISIVADLTRGRTDGYLYGMIRNGRGLMPPYNRIEELDRWDVVNYLRALQSGGTVAVGPLARPGVTGDKVPGPSVLGPQRPAPFYPPGGSHSSGMSARAADSVAANVAPVPAPAGGGARPITRDTARPPADTTAGERP